MPVFVRSGTIVLPGDVVAEGNYRAGEGVMRTNGRLVSLYLGIVRVTREGISVTPFKHIYIPRVGDIVVGKIRDVGVTNWLVDINSPYPAVLQVSEALSRPIDVTKIDLRRYLDIGDVIVAKVIEFDYLRDPMLTIKESRLGKVTGGLLLEFQPSLVYKVIESRLRLIDEVKSKLKCDIYVGKNGRVVVTGARDRLLEVVDLLTMIFEDFSPGSTSRIRAQVSRLGRR